MFGEVLGEAGGEGVAPEGRSYVPVRDWRGLGSACVRAGLKSWRGVGLVDTYPVAHGVGHLHSRPHSVHIVVSKVQLARAVVAGVFHVAIARRDHRLRGILSSKARTRPALAWV